MWVSETDVAPQTSDPRLELAEFDDTITDDDDPIAAREHFVTAILVAHDGSVWLPAVLTQLARQTRPLNAVIAVDTGSTDNSRELLTSSLGADRVIEVGSDHSFSAAVNLAATQVPAGPMDAIEWIWLLHDDSAPSSDCLEQLLRAADAHPSAGILGPKILGWHDQRLLLEVGVSVTGSGRRYTALERREHDQGQHDGARDVLSVSSAGMLIRRNLWERLRGFDANLPLFRNDLDLCWRANRTDTRVLVATDAVLHHREASAHGRRVEQHDRAHQRDREAAVHVLLAQVPGWQRPIVGSRLFLGSAVRASAALIGKDFDSARDEFLGTVGALRKPGRIAQSGRLVRDTTDEPSSAVRHLRPSPTTQARQTLEAVTGVLTTSGAPSSAVSALESGPVDDEAMYLEESGSWVRRMFWRPSVLLVLGLTVFAVVATRGLWWGPGVLQGGALLPAPSGAGDIWDLYTRAWHNVGPGSVIPAPPYLLVIFSVSAFLLGKAPIAVAVLSLLSIPLAGWAAYITLRGVIGFTPIRVWAAVAYALLPAVGGAISSGRIGTSIAAVALPFAVRSMIRISSPTGTVRRAAGTALLVSIVIAGVPGLWPLFAIAAAVMGVRIVLARAPNWNRIARRLALAVLAPVLLLMPWSWHVITNPVLLLDQPGVQSPRLGDPTLNALNVVLLHPGGPGMTPLWATAGLVIAGVLALLRIDRLGQITAVWAVGLLALVFGVVQSILLVTPPGGESAIRPWPGPATLVFGGALILAAALAVDGLRARMAGASFSWLQPVAGVLVVAAISTPVLSAVLWTPIAEGVMRKAPQSVVPAFVAAEAESPQAPRTLVLRQDRAGRVSYSLINGDGAVLGEADVSPPSSVWQELSPAVADLAAGLGGDEVTVIAGYGVRFILLAAGTSSDLIPILDGEPGLRRLATAQGEILWRIAGVTSRARVVAFEQAPLPVGVDEPQTVSTDPYIDQPMPDSVGDRTLVLGAAPQEGWRGFTVNTQTGERTALTNQPGPDGLSWSAGIAIPDGPVQVVVEFDNSARSSWLFVQVVFFVVLVVMALPARRREDEDVDTEDVIRVEETT